MNIKIQGGQEVYANSGSCYGVASYLEHEDYQRMEQGLEVDPFFSQDKTDLEKRVIVSTLDQNKAKLCKKDAKFFVLTVSPSQKELEQMGYSNKEQSKALKDFIRNDIIPAYAEGFGKNLTANDILYFAKIHHARGDNADGQMHAHIVISRKTKDNRIKISPQTNHKTKNNGVVKSGFNRTEFYSKIESAFDRSFGYDRKLEEKFEYLNVVKRGSIEDVERLVLNQSTQSLDISTTISLHEKQGIFELRASPIQNTFSNSFEDDSPLSPKRKKKKKGKDFSQSI